MKEEMNRTLRFLAWKARQWREKGVARQKAGDTDAAYGEGLKAYAWRQAAICEGQARRFSLLWQAVDSMISTAQRECENSDLFYARRKREMDAESRKQGGVDMASTASTTVRELAPGARVPESV